MSRTRDVARAAAIAVAGGPLHRLVRAGTRSGVLPAAGFRSAALKENPFSVRLAGGRRLVYEAVENDAVGRPLYWRGVDGYEPFTLKLFMRECRGARGVLDVGANTGLFTLLAKAASADAEVHAFEAVPSLAESVRRNLCHNDMRATVHATAVSDHAGHVAFLTSAKAPALGQIATGEVPDGWDARDIPAARIDDVVGDLHVDVLKIDIEGHEAAALRGALELLRRCRPVVFLEVLPWVPENPQPILDELGYEYLRIDERALVAVDELSGRADGDDRNYLCRPT